MISLPVMAVRMLAWRAPKLEIETRTVIVPPLPEAEAAFRQRLSAKRRSARLVAIEAVTWKRGASGEARLAGGLTAPVSRAHAPALKEAGWF